MLGFVGSSICQAPTGSSSSETHIPGLAQEVPPGGPRAADDPPYTYRYQYTQKFHKAGDPTTYVEVGNMTYVVDPTANPAADLGAVNYSFNVKVWYLGCSTTPPVTKNCYWNTTANLTTLQIETVHAFSTGCCYYTPPACTVRWDYNLPTVNQTPANFNRRHAWCPVVEYCSYCDDQQVNFAYDGQQVVTVGGTPFDCLVYTNTIDTYTGG